jgi:diguanylate cyclase (GGDEF)-like protein
MKSLRQVPIPLIAILGIIASVAVGLLSLSWERKIAALDVQHRAEIELAIINSDLQNAAGALDTIGAFFEASDKPVSAAEFGRFAAVVHQRSAGLRDAGWAPRVTAADRSSFEAAVRATLYPDFEIRERDEAGHVVRAGNRPEYYPILLLSPSERSRGLVGFDFASEAVRRAAVEQAIRTGRAVATPPITLLVGPGVRDGVVSFVPVYRPGEPGSGAQRAPDGLVYGVFDIRAMIENIVGAKRILAGFDIYLFDPDGPPGERLLYWPAGSAAAGAAPSEPALRAGSYQEGVVSIIDRRWGALLLPAAGIEGDHLTGNSIPLVVGGLLLTCLVVINLTASQSRNRQLEALTSSLTKTTEGLHQQAEKITHMARHDALTGLPNRRAFAEDLLLETTHARNGETAFAILLIDLDRFKPVNDTHGHLVGDQVLCEVARRLCCVIRAGDSVARLGGDEFVVVMRGDDERGAAGQLAERTIETLTQPITVAGATVELGASIGIARCPTDATTTEFLLRAADLAMYAAKRQTRVSFCFFDPSMAIDVLDQVTSDAARL